MHVCGCFSPFVGSQAGSAASRAGSKRRRQRPRRATACPAAPRCLLRRAAQPRPSAPDSALTAPTLAPHDAHARAAGPPKPAAANMRRALLLPLALAALAAVAYARPDGSFAEPKAPLWQGACPKAWPAGLKGTGVAVTIKFRRGPGADCAAPGFPAAAAAVSGETARALTKAAKAHAGESRLLDPAGVEFFETATAGCASGDGVGVAQTIVDGVEQWDQMPASRWLQELSNGLHLADACPPAPATYERASVGAVYNEYCAALGGGGARVESALMCVQGAPESKYISGRTAQACFPGDATLTRADPESGAALGPLRMDEVAIGDAVLCLKPSGLPRTAGDVGEYRDAKQAYAPGVCRVFGYLDADKDRVADFVAIHYTDAAGRPAKLRASPEHLVFVAAKPAPAAAPSVARGGAARRADAVRAGDLLVIRAEPEAKDAAAALGAAGAPEPLFYTAAVTKVTSESHTGIFAPLLTDAGLPLVDGAAAFAWVHLTPDAEPHPMQNIGEYMRHIRLWMDFDAALTSGCAGADCPCLDAADDAARPCLRLGDRLSALPAGKSDFAARSLETLLAAGAQGRGTPDYASGIAAAKVYQANPWLWRASRALGFKSHTLGIYMTDRYLTAGAGKAAGRGRHAISAE
ncbi:MAG: hypothetical protein J3K34DRAFT_54153 [Monoraphidium minutum]|nr:MAG: hypothetical protein J3K34DRAFT_54153 [Monoraphidium minutum]